VFLLLLPPPGPCVKLVEKFEAQFSYITNEDRTFFFHTNLDAPKYRLVKITLPPPGQCTPDQLAAAQFEVC
jgi:prolyl oligopeptidase